MSLWLGILASAGKKILNAFLFGKSNGKIYIVDTQEEILELENFSTAQRSVPDPAATVALSNWTTVTTFGAAANWVSFGNDTWIIVGASGLIKTSTDSITWTTQTSNFGTTIIRSVAYGNGLWVAAGDAGQVRTSTDAVTWITQNSNLGTSISIVSYKNGNWYLTNNFGTAVTRTSTDGLSWKPLQNLQNYDFFEYDGEKLYAYNRSSQHGFVSIDNGQSWFDTIFANPSNPSSAIDFYCAKYSNDRWAFGVLGGVAMSSNGVSFNAYSFPLNQTGANIVLYIEGAKGLWLGTASNGNTVVSTNNGSTWTSQNLGGRTWRYTFANDMWISVSSAGVIHRANQIYKNNDSNITGIQRVSSNNKVAVSATGGQVFYSTDLISWTTSVFLDGEVSSLAFFNENIYSGVDDAKN